MISENRFEDHINQNNAEFAQRQVVIFGSGPPGFEPGRPGWYYLDNSIVPHRRYEYVGPTHNDWVMEAGGPHDHDDRYYTKVEVDAIISSVVQGVRILGAAPLQFPDGSTTVYTLPGGDEYLSDTLHITINGLDEGAPSRISSAQFEVPGDPLLIGDVLRCYYVKSN